MCSQAKQYTTHCIYSIPRSHKTNIDMNSLLDWKKRLAEFGLMFIWWRQSNCKNGCHCLILYLRTPFLLLDCRQLFDGDDNAKADSGYNSVCGTLYDLSQSDTSFSLYITYHKWYLSTISAKSVFAFQLIYVTNFTPFLVLKYVWPPQLCLDPSWISPLSLILPPCLNDSC